jgi:hypothetical protein
VVGAAVVGGGAAVVGTGVVGGAGLLVVAATDVGATVAGNVTTGAVFDVTCSEAHAANVSATSPVPHQRRFILRSVDTVAEPKRSRYCGAG